MVFPRDLNHGNTLILFQGLGLERKYNNNAYIRARQFADRICAAMLGRLRMSIDDAITEHTRLMCNVFGDKKLIIHGGSGAFRATKLEQGLKAIVEKATGDAEEGMMEENTDGVKCKVCVPETVAISAVALSLKPVRVVYAMSAHNMNAGMPCAFRTYPANINAMPDCPIWKALRASTAHPELFKTIEIRELGVGQHYVGGLSFSNPTAQMLKEAATLFPDRAVASVVNIGTGHTRTIQVPHSRRFEHFLPIGALTISRALKVAHEIAMDNERVAEEMADRFSKTKGIYYRLSVDQGMQNIAPSEWGKQSEVASHTTAYLQKVETTQLLDALVDAVQKRRSTTKTYQIGKGVLTLRVLVDDIFSLGTTDGRAASSPNALATLSGYCPLPTSLFTGRSMEVGLVTRYFENNEQAQQVFVLHGLGGAGKTQTALKSVELMASR